MNLAWLGLDEERRGVISGIDLMGTLLLLRASGDVRKIALSDCLSRVELEWKKNFSRKKMGYCLIRRSTNQLDFLTSLPVCSVSYGTAQQASKDKAPPKLQYTYGISLSKCLLLC